MQNQNILIIIDIKIKIEIEKSRVNIFGGFESLRTTIEDKQVIHQVALVFQQLSCF